MYTSRACCSGRKEAQKSMRVWVLVILGFARGKSTEMVLCTVALTDPISLGTWIQQKNKRSGAKSHTAPNSWHTYSIRTPWRTSIARCCSSLGSWFSQGSMWWDSMWWDSMWWDSSRFWAVDNILFYALLLPCYHWSPSVIAQGPFPSGAASCSLFQCMWPELGGLVQVLPSEWVLLDWISAWFRSKMIQWYLLTKPGLFPENFFRTNWEALKIQIGWLVLWDSDSTKLEWTPKGRRLMPRQSLQELTI